MKLPAMRYSDGIRKHKQVKFGGLDHRVGAEDGALYDMRNLHSDDYPILAVRPKRWMLGQLAKPNGLFYWKGLMWVDGTQVYFDGQVVGQVEDSRKTFGAIGPYIVIFPDKVCYNVTNGTMEPMILRWEQGGYSFYPDGVYINYRGPLDVIDGTILNTDENNDFVCVYREQQYQGMEWDELPESARVTTPDFSEIFRVGDAVKIHGLLDASGEPLEDGYSAIIQGFEQVTYGERSAGSGGVYFYCWSKIIFADGSLSGLSVDTSQNVVIERDVPDLKYICEDGNRLWGCDSNSIYACKLGDPFNWNVFEGLETDSWALTPASSGEFTGCINFQGYPTFFKEDRLYKVYGSLPSNFSVVDSPCLGVAAGCADTLALAWGSVFYLGSNGPMVYTGSLPRPVNHELGDIRLTGGCAGSDGLKYYASLSDPSGQSRLYVYDVQRELWHIEDGLEAVSFCRVDGDVYCLGADGMIRILGAPKTHPEGATEEAPFPWMAEFADFTHEEANHKGVSKLQLRLGLDEGSTVTVAIQFDSDGVWRNVRTLTGDGGKRSFYLPIVPRRCDHYRLRLEGIGRAKVYSLARETYTGSECAAK